MLECDSNIFDNLNNGRACDVILFDFCRAFDKIDHNILCHKLKAIGINGCYLQWIIGYISRRKQFLSYNNASSNYADVTSGVEQGSCIGPTLFSIFINDLCKVIKHAKSSLFADDLKISEDVSTPECREFLKQDVSAVYDWSVANKLPISIAKCVILHYRRNNVKQAFTINQQIITESDNCLDLGVRHCDNMKYEHHARDTTHMAARFPGMVMKLFCTRDPSFMTKLYTPYICPVLEYTAPARSPSGKGVIARL